MDPPFRTVYRQGYGSRSEFVQKCLRLLEVCRVKPFGKPIAHWGKQAGGCLANGHGIGYSQSLDARRNVRCVSHC